jgi:organic radical activating enzyme
MNYKNNKIIKITNNSNYVIIDWELGNYCNYKCSYCFPGSNTGDQRPPKISEEIKDNIRHMVSEIKKHQKKEKIINFTLSGGEPTMYYDLENLVSFLKTLGTITIITNGSRTLDWWKHHWKYFDHVIISYHTEFADYNHVQQLGKFLSTKVAASLHVMMHYQNFEQTVAIYLKFHQDLLEYQITVQPKFIRIGKGQLPYTEEQKQILLNLPLIQKRRREALHEELIIDTGAVIEKGGPKTIGYLTGVYGNDYECAAHTQFLQIDRFGNVGRMSCNTRFNEEVNILDADFITKFKIEKEYVQCESSNCNCLGLHQTAKKLINNPK